MEHDPPEFKLWTAPSPLQGFGAWVGLKATVSR